MAETVTANEISQGSGADALRRLHRDNDYPAVIEHAEALEQRGAEVDLLLALSYIMSGEQQKGEELLRAVVDEAPDNHDWHSDRALALILMGRLDEAATLLEGLTGAEHATAVDFGRLAAVWVARQDNEKAAGYYQEAIDREPGRQHWHANFATVLSRMQRLEEALEHYQQALQIDPDFKPAITGRQSLLIALDRAEELIEALQAELEKDPDNLDLRLQCGRALIANDRFTDGVQCLRGGLENQAELLDLREEDPEKFEELRPRQIALLDELARHWSERQRHVPARAAFRSIQELEPKNLVPSTVGEINALVELGRFEAAEERLLEAEELFPDENPIKLARTHMLCENGRYDEAESILRELVQVYPGNANLMANLAQTLMWTGDIDEAADWYEKAAEINPQQLANMVRARRLPSEPEAIEKMEQIAENKAGASGPRESMAFALAELHDKLGDCDRAFHFLDLGNELARKTIEFDPESFTHLIDRVIDVFNQEFFDALPPIRGSDRTPVFVVGMPRSGTTLTEQILCSHPDVFGAGELDLIPALRRLMPKVLNMPKRMFPGIMRHMTPELREEAERYYLYGISQYDEEHQYVVDKMPHNFVNLGLIASILPSAKIIHIQRDPRDNALSNFQQNFKAKHGGMGYAFKLEHIAEEINNYHRVMQHWREVLPVPVFELTYEEMVEDQEGMTRQLLDFIGVAWDESVRDFHRTERAVRTASVSQVRQPIYKSSKQKWRRYEKYLGPLLDNLDAAVLEPWEAG